MPHEAVVVVVVILDRGGAIRQCAKAGMGMATV